MMYAKNATRGQWKAHGRYIARESARMGRLPEGGFDTTEQEINIPARFGQWQSAGDERMLKIIVSPEFGEDRVDLVHLTRDLMQRMTSDLNTELQWVATAHFNTDNPHVHIALRGIRENGTSLRIERDYIKHGIRRIAEDLCARQLGYRTQLDVAEAGRREVSQQRFTSLDRAIARNKPTTDHSWDFLIRQDPMESLGQYVIARLRNLEGMGLAAAAGLNQWRVRQDFETALRTMQRLGDRQKILAEHGVPV
jgi:type IV secretory pathway VirD2 relaxase